MITRLKDRPFPGGLDAGIPVVSGVIIRWAGPAYVAVIPLSVIVYS